MTYRGRLAPTPTGDMHVGHARTYVTAWERATAAGGALVLRIEDLDPLRCRAEYAARTIEDLEWLGIRWSEGPHFQSRRRPVFEATWRALRDAGVVYPSTVSRREVRDAAHDAQQHNADERQEPAGAEKAKDSTHRSALPPQNHLDASVLVAALYGRVGCHGIGIRMALCGDAARIAQRTDNDRASRLGA